MTGFVFACVLGAAVMHAGWNATLRGGGDGLWSMTLMMVAIAAVTATGLAFIPWPNVASRPYVIASAAIHAGYSLSLVRTYRTGELGQAYPVARGSSPVLIALGAAIFAHEGIGILQCAALALVSIGILSLAFQGEGIKADYLPPALMTGFLIAGYTVVDGIGVRLAGSGLAYANGMFLSWSLTVTAICVMMRGRPSRYTVAQTAAALAGGLVSIAAYGIVIWAMQYASMAAVSALRETSAVFAAIAGRVFLEEKLTTRRIASCVAVASGAALLMS